MATVYCHMCGTELQDTAKFCKSCGTPVYRPESEPAPVPVPEEIPVQPVVEIPAEPVNPAPPVVEEAPAPTQEPVAESPAPAEEAPVIPEPAVDTPAEPLAEPAPETPVWPDPTPEPEPESEPVVPTPVEPAPPQPEEPKKRELYRKRGVGRTFLAALICLLVFIFAFASIAAYDAMQIVSGNFIVNTVTKMVQEVKLTEIPAKDLVADVEDEDMSIVEWAINEVANQSEGAVVVTEESVAAFIEEAKLDEYLNDTLLAYVDAFTTDNDDPVVSKEDLRTLLTDHIPLAEKTFNIVIDSTQVDAFVDNVEEQGVLERLEPKVIKQQMGSAMEIFSIAARFANVAFIVLLVITALLALWLFANNRWNILRTLGDYGILATILGVLFSGVAIVGAYLTELWSSLIPSELSIVIPAINGFLEGTLVPSLIITGVGILLILVFVIGKKIIVKSANKQV